MARIVIITHEADRLAEDYYFAHALGEEWKSRGHDVVVRRGPESCEDADLAILHVDLTVIPDRYVLAVRRCPKTINGGVVDISKRVISRQLVRPFDGYRGPVIVKTNRNCGGAGDLRREPPRGRLAARFERLRRRRGWAWQSELEHESYRILDSPREVPWAAWLNRGLVVERFMPERRDGMYCLRTWVFLGDRETNSLSYSDEPIVKSANVKRREVVPEVPDDLRALRRDLHFDFGKFDYAIVDGKTVLYDANRTPTLGAMQPEQYLPRIRHLADGLASFL